MGGVEHPLAPSDRRTSARKVPGCVLTDQPAAQRAEATTDELRRRQGDQFRGRGWAVTGRNPPRERPGHDASMECAPLEIWTRGANHRHRIEKKKKYGASGGVNRRRELSSCS